MEEDPTKIVETDKDEEQNAKERKRLNTRVALTVALLATFLAICRVKDNNIRQAMTTDTGDQIEQWAIYQAHKTRAEVARATADRFRLQAETLPIDKRSGFLRRAADYDRIARDELKEAGEIRERVRRDGMRYDRWNLQHDKFDVSEAILSIAIALLAVTALIQVGWLYWVAMFPTAFGLLMGIAAFINWNIEPERLVKFLGA